MTKEMETFLQKNAKKDRHVFPCLGDLTWRFFEQTALCFALLLHRILPTAVAHGNIGVVSSDQDLSALGDHLSVFIDACVDDRFLSAGADGFDLGDGICNLKQSAASFKQVREKVGTKPKAKHGYIKPIHDTAELVDLSGCEKLTFVGDDRMVVIICFKHGVQIGVGKYLIGGCFQPDAWADYGGTVAVIQCGLDQPQSERVIWLRS